MTACIKREAKWKVYTLETRDKDKNKKSLYYATCTQIWLHNKQKQNLRRIKSRHIDNCSITSKEVFAGAIEFWLTISTLIALIYERKQRNSGTERHLCDVFCGLGDAINTSFLQLHQVAKLTYVFLQLQQVDKFTYVFCKWRMTQIESKL